MVDGGMIMFKIDDFVMIFIVKCGLQWCLSIFGMDIFENIEVEVIEDLVIVVKIVFVLMVVMLMLFVMWW